MGDIGTQLRLAVEALSANSQNQGRRLRELLDEAPAVFQQVVAAMLAGARETPELRYVIALLSSRGMLAPMLQDLSSRDRGAAGVVAQLAQRMDPGFDRSMARQGTEPRGKREHTRPDPEFLLGLLDTLSGGLCLLPMLEPLRESEDPHVRSRLALLLGRVTRAQEWFQALERDGDPRVRANAIESLWSVRSKTSAGCFVRGLEDDNHRVVANSMVGLYLEGDTAGVSGLVAMAQHESAQFRASAAWAMGRTGDTRFLPVLRQMRRGSDQESTVVRNALQASARINQATIAATRVESRVTCLRRRILDDSTLDAIIVAHDEEPGGLPVLKPTDWQIRGNRQPVWSYQAEHVAAGETLAVGLALPTSPAEDAVRAPHWGLALAPARYWRRPNDQFAVVRYSESAGMHFQGGPLSGPGAAGAARPAASPWFRGDASAALSAAERWNQPLDALEHLAGTLGPASGRPHLIAVLDAIPESRCELDKTDALLALLRERQAILHCLTTARLAAPLSETFQRLSRDTGGFQLHCLDIGELGTALRTLIAATFGYYRLRCQLTAPVEQVEIELQAEGHQGRLLMAGDDAPRTTHVAA